ncbi:transcription factor MBP1 [Coccidioides immitis RMSCC 3703]|uniref:Cell pattern formation-associated protein stuA n=2 Tax=Coccidioides immitis TaxID=5501 RepID=A0A0J8RBE0_COCIT|nr:transcription factor MBP1 [Coccidioides immitis RMSCC 2394]KMU82136.1 transcription factor MBP1 [Coccidioides immitis RMSCC 3703]
MATMDSGIDTQIYSATYSGVPVYEFKVGSDSVMRRRHDDWINATHILKVAGLDKPSRTRILEREVQKGTHEKIQGGYGKYQGTWVPLADGRAVAERNKVLDQLLPIFDFVPGDRTPPPAPKHTTAVSSRPKAQRTGASGRRGGRASSFASMNTRAPPAASFVHSEDAYSQIPQSFNDQESVDQASRESSSVLAEEDIAQVSQHPTHPRKRKQDRDLSALTVAEQQHIMYGDELLDYFMTVGDAPARGAAQPPIPPQNFQPDRPIDDQGNTALHWACAMGSLDVVKDLIMRGANTCGLTRNDETPLVRAVLFTNNYEKRTMPELAEILKNTISFRDWFGATVFNHLAVATKSKGKWRSSRYYCQVLIAKLSEMYPQHEVGLLLASQDSYGDTAALTAAKNGCYRLAEILLKNCPEAGNLPNKHGETANEVMMMIQQQQVPRDYPHRPSSATQHSVHEGDIGGVIERGGENMAQCQLSCKNPVAAALLKKISAIMDDANGKLTQAYGEVKSRPQSFDGKSHPREIYEQLEAERETIRKDKTDTLSKEAESVPFEDLVSRHDGAKQKYASLLEGTQELTLSKRIGPHGGNVAPPETENNKPERLDGAATTTTTTTAAAAAAAAPPSSEKENELAQKIELIRKIAQAEMARKNGTESMMSHRADAGPDARLNVHRKLVAMATRLPEQDLDPMAKDLAVNLEFVRAHQSRPGKPLADAGRAFKQNA